MSMILFFAAFTSVDLPFDTILAYNRIHSFQQTSLIATTVQYTFLMLTPLGDIGPVLIFIIKTGFLVSTISLRIKNKNTFRDLNLSSNTVRSNRLFRFLFFSIIIQLKQHYLRTLISILPVVILKLNRRLNPLLSICLTNTVLFV